MPSSPKSLLRKRYVTLMLCALALAGSVFAFSSQTVGERSRLQSAPQITQQATAIPDHVLYRFVFRHVRLLKEQAEENERRGRGPSSLIQRFQEDAALNEAQFWVIDEIARDCERELEEQDRRARVIIDAFRARYPAGQLPSGESLPPPPAELAVLQQGRDAIIMRAHSRLREALGGNEFSRFDGFVRQRIGPNVQVVRPNN